MGRMGDNLRWDELLNDIGSVEVSVVAQPEQHRRALCPYCRHVRIADGRGLCRECGAPEDVEVQQQHNFDTAMMTLTGYALAADLYDIRPRRIEQY